MDEKRENRLRRLLKTTGENTKSGAIDVAIKHYLSDLQSKKRVADGLPTEVIEELHTPYIPPGRETTVGRGED